MFPRNASEGTVTKRMEVRTYEALRHYWISELARNGELGALSLREWKMLERGSLDALAATRLAHLDRTLCASRRAVVFGYVLSLTGLFAVLSGRLAEMVNPGVSWPLNVETLAALVLAVPVAVVVHAACTYLTRALIRKRQLYRRLREARHDLVAALR